MEIRSIRFQLVETVGTSDIYWKRLIKIRKKKQMTFRSIWFQVVETEPFKHFFCSYFDIMHGFIKCMPLFVNKGIISKVSKVRTKVLKKQITMIYVKYKRSKYGSLWHTIKNVEIGIEGRPYLSFFGSITKVIMDDVHSFSLKYLLHFFS